MGSVVSTRALDFFFAEDFLVVPCAAKDNDSVTGSGNSGWAVDVDGGSCPKNTP